MDDTKTLLQQIRDKEQEVNKTIAGVRQETDAIVAAAKADAEKTLKDLEQQGRLAAEDLTRNAAEKIAAEIDQLKKTAADERERIERAGERNKGSAVETIIHRVTMR